MTEFTDCDYVILRGGANDGIVVPVARDVNMIQFTIKGGALITYRRAIPAQFSGDHQVFRIEAK